MDRNAENSVFSILRSRETVVELLIAAIILAFGVNLLSDIFALVHSSAPFRFVVGLLCVLLPIAYWARKFVKASTFELELKAFLPIEKKSKLLFGIDRYYYSEECNSILTSVFKENPILKTQWVAEMFPNLRPNKLTKNKPKPGSSNHRIARELTEYVVLHLLSMHLTDYFNSLEKNGSNGIVKYRREDLSAIVLGNRILDLISKQPEDRPALGHREEEQEGHELVMMWKDGLIHSRFELTLPQGSNVHRTTSNEISIEHSRFKMKIAVSGGESSGVPPQYFDELYLNRKFLDVDYRVVNVSIRGALTWSGMLGVGNWNYFSWIDSFIETLESHIDFEQFVMQIGYQQSLTAHILGRSRNANSKVGISKSK